MQEPVVQEPVKEVSPMALSDAFFAFDSYSLSAEAKGTLEANARGFRFLVHRHRAVADLRLRRIAPGLQEIEHLVAAFQRVERLLGNAWCDCAAGGPFGQMVRQCTRFGAPVQGKLAVWSWVDYSHCKAVTAAAS